MQVFSRLRGRMNSKILKRKVNKDACIFKPALNFFWNFNKKVGLEDVQV